MAGYFQDSFGNYYDGATGMKVDPSVANATGPLADIQRDLATKGIYNGQGWAVLRGTDGQFKLFDPTGTSPAEVRQQFPQGNPQDRQYWTTPDPTGGSDAANIGLGLGFLGAGFGLGQMGMLPGATTAASTVPTWMQPTASGVADTGFGAGTAPLNGSIMGASPGVGVTGAAAEASGAPSWLTGANPLTVAGVGLGAANLATSMGGSSSPGIDTTGLIGNQNPFPGADPNFYQNLFGTSTVDPNGPTGPQMNLNGNPLLGNIDAFGNPTQPDWTSLLSGTVPEGSVGGSTVQPGGLSGWQSFLQGAAKKLIGGGGSTSGSSGLFNSDGSLNLGSLGDVFGSGLSMAARSVPGLMALDYAKSQPSLDLSGLQAIASNSMKPIAPVDTSNLTGILSGLQGNSDALVKSATDPIQMNIASGYGDLLQSQAKRGIRGSSFGDTAVGDFLAKGDMTLGNAAASAKQASLGMQGSLAGTIADINARNNATTLQQTGQQSSIAALLASLQQQAQATKNNLYGKAFDVLGRGLNPGGFGGQLTLAGG